MANRTLGTITTMLNLNNSAFKKGIGNSRKDVNKFSSSVTKLGGVLAGTFAVGRIMGFTAEVSKLAATAEGVAIAFRRIQPNISFLSELKQATAGTVSELDLMRRAVMASNFKIPLTELGSLLKFATKRAQETGESVSYLVNSIVIGIGRKSPLILDNLGISAVELREKLDNVGHSGATVGDVAKAVGEIAEDAMGKMGDVIETTAIKQERLNAKVTDLKVDLGNVANVFWSEILPAITSATEALGYFAIGLRGGKGSLAMEEAIRGDQFRRNLAKGLEAEEKSIMGETQMRMFRENISEQEALYKSLTAHITHYHRMLGAAWSPNNITRYETYIKHFKDMRDALGEVNEEYIENITNLELERNTLIGIQESLALGDPQLEGINARLIEIKNTIKAIRGELEGIEKVVLPDILTPDAMGADAYTGPLYGKYGLISPGTLSGFGFAEPESWQDSVTRRKREMALFKKILGETGDEAEATSKQIGVMLVNSFDSLGAAVANVVNGMEGAFQKLGQLILQNIGNVLIAAGMAMGLPQGLSLVVAGAAIQFGGGILGGFKSSAGSSSYNDAWGRSIGLTTEGIKFRVEGKDLVAALDRNSTAVKRFT